MCAVFQSVSGEHRWGSGSVSTGIAVGKRRSSGHGGAQGSDARAAGAPGLYRETHTHVHSAAVTHLSLCNNDVLMPHSPPVSARSPVLEHGRRVRCALPVPLELRVLRRETRCELSVIVSGARHVARDGNRCLEILQSVSVCDKQQRNTDATRDVQRLFHSVAASPKVPAN